jgi:ribonuclease BN (tRNA processing enzyme)
MTQPLDIRLLGSGGWVPTSRRQTSCLYVRHGEDVMLVDAGSGVGRLYEDPVLLDGVERLHVVLTHWHLDHVFGLGFLAFLPTQPEVRIFAPGREALGTPAAAVAKQLLGPPFFAATFEAASELFAEVLDLEEGENDVGPFRLRVRMQRRHGTPSYALRLDGVAYVTDTAYDEGNVELARGARVLFHEAVHAADETDDVAHTAAGEAARIACAAGVERLILIHVDPALETDAELLRHARAVFPRAEVGSDGPVLLGADVGPVPLRGK